MTATREELLAAITDDQLEPHLPEYLEGAKRCGIQRSVWLPSFYVGWSPRNDNENAEGPWSDWVALARAILKADREAREAEIRARAASVPRV
jgi:hypothetical protein